MDGVCAVVDVGFVGYDAGASLVGVGNSGNLNVEQVSRLCKPKILKVCKYRRTHY